MFNIDPVKTKSWQKIKKHFLYMKNIKIIDLFKKDNMRYKKFSFFYKKKIFFDFSKNIICLKTIKLFINLLNEINFKNYFLCMISGEKINLTENRAVLHIFSRDIKKFFFKKKLISLKKYNLIKQRLNKIKNITHDILSYKWLSFSGKRIKNIVNIGIGGSDLGPRMICKALTLYKNNINTYFVSNIDATDILDVLNKISPDETIFIICSKTFTTSETLSNAKIAKLWISNFYLNNKLCIKYHFIGITNNIEKAINFGIENDNILYMDEWIGGRYSICSSVGLIISLSIGFKNFLKLLDGFNDMDIHFYENEYIKNIPVILAIISIWYINFFDFNNELISVYSEYLSLLPLYLQQLCMESNGKNINRKGKIITEYNTCPIIWGGLGTNSQHSFYQLLHQGTHNFLCDFIVEINNNNNIYKSHLKLISNFFAQTHSLSFGDIFLKLFNLNSKKFSDKFMYFINNKPNNIFLLKKINPYTLGSLISLYEHKTFTQGVIWNIFSFDQWGVELGKKISNKILVNLNKKRINNLHLDNSTINLIKIFNRYYNL